MTRTDLEERLSVLLDLEAERLPRPEPDLDAVVGRGIARRRRARAGFAAAGVSVALAAVALAGPLLAALDSSPAETVVADRSLAPVRDSDIGDPGPIMTIEPFPTSAPFEPTTSTTESSPTTTVTTTTTTTVVPTSTTTSTSTSSTSTTTTAPAPPPGGQRSTDDVIDRLADSEILFFSNSDGCRGIENGQAHPDWVEGQTSGGRNTDGTPTYGFAYNTGDATRGEYSWGFEERSFALSGECVLRIGLDGAYDDVRAVRIFRRYDRGGELLPGEAYYSAWYYFDEELSYDNRATIGGQTVYGFWNVFQVKNKIDDESLSALSFNAGKVTGDDHMAFHLWSKTECGAVEECSAAGAIPQVGTPRPIPMGEWVHFEIRLVARADGSGRLEGWQDGVKIYDYTGVTERVGTDRRQWSINSYGTLHRPASHDLFIDDALISTRPIHPELFD